MSAAPAPGAVGDLIADRFAPLGGEHAWDLALDEPVIVRKSAISDWSIPQWCDHAAQIASLMHPALALCVDFGEQGGSCFQAYVARAAISAFPSSQSLRSPVAGLERLLDQCNVPPRELNPHPVRPSLFMPALRTAPSTVKEPRARSGSHGPFRCSEWVAGARLLSRPEWAVLIELLDETSSRLRWIALGGEPGSGRTTTLRWLAREARLRGWRVMAAPLLERAVTPRSMLAPLLDRQLLVLADGPPFVNRAALGLALLCAVERSTYPPLVVSTGADAPPGAIEITLAPFSADDLRRITIVARPVSNLRWTRATSGACGNPALHLRALGFVAGRDAIEEPVRHAREQPAAIFEPARFGAARCTTTPARPPADARLVRRIAQVQRLLASGRHAAAERQLRESGEALARRGEDHESAALSLKLADLLLRRGRVDGALGVVSAGSERALGAPAIFTRLALLRGIALLEAARLHEAEGVLRTLSIAAGAEVGAATRTELARVLLWLGCLDEAEATLGSTPNVDPTPALRIDRLALLADVALKRRDFFAAGQATRDAVASAGDPSGTGDPLVRALITRARVSAATGDLKTAINDVRGALRLARRVHAPLLAVRATIVESTVHLLADDSHGWQSTERRLRRWMRHRLPPLIRLEVWRALASGRRPGSDVALLRKRGLALARVAGIPPDWWDAGRLQEAVNREATPMLDDVLRVLEMCHEADDERRTLEGVANLVRERTGAAAVVFLAVDGTALSPLAWAGVRPKMDDGSLALRAVESGLPLPPQPTGRGCEAAVPVRYGAAPVGVLTCRWLSGLERGRDVMTLLSATAAAAAPCLRVALDRRLPPRDAVSPVPELVGVSDAIAQVRQATARAAMAPFPVLIDGESGSGKELVARAVHRLGPRRDRRFCEVNAAALTDDLLESELFGHARGAFTGAVADRAGLFEEAHGGTLFLDEVGELSPRAQAKLLRALQEGDIRRVGEAFSRKVDVRIVAATNRALPAEAEAGRFRQDLLYRLDVVHVSVPPLRDRVEDIPVLAQHFWAAAVARTGSRATLAPETITALAQYAWPGNVRELQNVLAAMAVAAPLRGRVGPSALPAAVTRGAVVAARETLEQARRQFEERFVRAVLARAGGHRGRAAAQLGLTRQGLAKLLQRLGVEVSR